MSRFEVHCCNHASTSKGDPLWPKAAQLLNERQKFWWILELNQKNKKRVHRGMFKTMECSFRRSNVSMRMLDCSLFLKKEKEMEPEGKKRKVEVSEVDVKSPAQSFDSETGTVRAVRWSRVYKETKCAINCCKVTLLTYLLFKRSSFSLSVCFVAVQRSCARAH